LGFLTFLFFIKNASLPKQIFILLFILLSLFLFTKITQICLFAVLALFKSRRIRYDKEVYFRLIPAQTCAALSNRERKGVYMSPQKSNPESSFRARLSLKKTLLCFGLLWILVLVSSLLYYTLGNAAGRSYWHIFNSSLFFVNIPVFCYALLSFVAERGLFNGLRYSLKQVRTFFFKHHRSQLMEEYAAATEEEPRLGGS